MRLGTLSRKKGGGVKSAAERYAAAWSNRGDQLVKAGWIDKGVDGCRDNAVLARYYHPDNHHWLRVYPRRVDPGHIVKIFSKKRNQKRQLITEFSSWAEFIDLYPSLPAHSHQG